MMFLYNITVKADPAISSAWLDWMLDFHIPEVMDTGCFIKHQLLKLAGTDETEGPIYAIQYYAESLEKYEYYIHRFSAALRKKTMEKWGDQIITFRTLMEVVN